MNNDPINVLVIQPLMDELTQRLTKRFKCGFLYAEKNIDMYLHTAGENVRAVATRGDVGLDASIMARLPNLEIIVVFGVGTDAIDLAEARRRNIIVTITSDILTDDVADLAMGLVLATSRQIVFQDTFARSGQWSLSAPRLGHKVSGKRLGILGLGKIGSAIARRARAFDMQVGYCDRSSAVHADYQRFDNIHALADFSDFLVLSLPGGGANSGKIDKRVFESLGAEGTLINIARGSLVNETDLVDALRNGTLRGAGLDVYEREPHIPEALFAMDNVVITPHIASGTMETRQAMADNVFDNLESYFTRNVALTPVN